MKTLLDVEHIDSNETPDDKFGLFVSQRTYEGELVLKLNPNIYYTIKDLEFLLELAISKEKRYNYCKKVNYQKYIDVLYPPISNKNL